MTRPKWEYFRSTKKNPDAWIQTINGVFWPLEPDVELIDIRDIAWALSHQCRYAGHVNRFYSVAEHSLWMTRVCSCENKLWALLHDATEAYLSDICKPIKKAVTGYAEIEANLERAIAQRFNLPWPMPEEVKELDYRILTDERQALIGLEAMPWHTGEGIGIAEEIRDSILSPRVINEEFLKAFDWLAKPQAATFTTGA